MKAESYMNAAMQWGVDTAADARMAYEFYRDARVEEVGFVPHPSGMASGASPDGLVGDDGLLELKCPNTATHIETLLGGAVPEKYLLQTQWQMACTGRTWCDLASYDPRLPESMSLHVVRILRDDKLIADLEQDVAKFLAELDETVARLRHKYEPEARAA